MPKSYKDERYYSGPESIQFWDRIQHIKSKVLQRHIYLMACELQNHENAVLAALCSAEEPKPKRKKVTK